MGIDHKEKYFNVIGDALMNIVNRVDFEIKFDNEEIHITCSAQCPPEVLNQALLQVNQYCNQVIAQKAEQEKIAKEKIIDESEKKSEE